ncbi:hypothetical protein ACSBR2_030275 [Camellia fascicularis]
MLGWYMNFGGLLHLEVIGQLDFFHVFPMHLSLSFFLNYSNSNLLLNLCRVQITWPELLVFLQFFLPHCQLSFFYIELPMDLWNDLYCLCAHRWSKSCKIVTIIVGACQKPAA